MTWLPLRFAPPASDTGPSTHTFTDHSPAADKGFYRVVGPWNRGADLPEEWALERAGLLTLLGIKRVRSSGRKSLA